MLYNIKIKLNINTKKVMLYNNSIASVVFYGCLCKPYLPLKY